MKSVKAKAKTKRGNAKIGRVKFAAKEISPVVLNPDFSNLRKPVDNSVSNLLQVTKLFENGSDEVKALLANECNVIYECRICLSLFRSVVNFISHKRIYCNERFNVTHNRNMFHDYDMVVDNAVQTVEEPEEATLKENLTNARILRSQAPRHKNKKDLTEVIDMLQKKHKENTEDISVVAVGSPITDMTPDVVDDAQVSTGSTSSNSTGLHRAKLKTSNHKVAQDAKLQNVTQKTATASGSLSTNQMEKDGSPVQIDDSDEENEPRSEVPPTKNILCSICNARFSTRKTLMVHMRTLHTSHRMCYPCPCCTSTFTNSWSVYRHLFKVHRKTNDQVRKLRAIIQDKAYRKEITNVENSEKAGQNNTVTSANKETQEWINHLESDTELQRCGGCGKRFDRKAALCSHLQQCRARIAICNNINKGEKLPETLQFSEAEKLPETLISINEQSEEIHVSAVNVESIPVTTVPQEDFLCLSSSPEPETNNQLSIRVETVASLSETDWENMDKIPFDNNALPSNINTSNKCDMVTSNTGAESTSDNNILDVPEIVYTRIDKPGAVAVNIGSKKRKVMRNDLPKLIISSKESLVNSTEGDSNTDAMVPSSNKCPASSSCKVIIERVDHTIIMEKKIAKIANLRKLQCLPCKRKFTSMTNLRRHMAIHVGWNRYRCKLCDFKCFVKCDCVAHCNKMHNAQNNRATIADMVEEIPQNQYACKNDTVVDVPAVGKTTDTSVSIDSNGNEKTNAEAADVQHQHGSDEKRDAVDTTMKETESCAETENEEPHAQRLDADPDLKRMIMEVIFGSSTTSKGEEKNSMQSNTENSGETDGKLTDSSENKSESYKHVNSKETNSLISDNLRPQRPIRNRVKPVNKDFIYDLKEVVFRREPLPSKGTGLSSGKMTQKKSARVQSQSNECNLRIRIDSSDSSKSDMSVYENEDIADKFNKINSCSEANIRVSTVPSLQLAQQAENAVCCQK